MQETKRTIQNNRIFVLSILVAAYFIVLLAADKFHYSPVLLGVIAEILTIPAFLLLAVIFILSVIGLVKSRRKAARLPFVSILIQLAITILLVIKS